MATAAPGSGRIVMGALAPHPPHLVYADNPTRIRTAELVAEQLHQLVADDLDELLIYIEELEKLKQ